MLALLYQGDIVKVQTSGAYEVHYNDVVARTAKAAFDLLNHDLFMIYLKIEYDLRYMPNMEILSSSDSLAKCLKAQYAFSSDSTDIISTSFALSGASNQDMVDAGIVRKKADIYELDVNRAVYAALCYQQNYAALPARAAAPKTVPDDSLENGATKYARSWLKLVYKFCAVFIGKFYE